jgi:prophage DNA circulation protein
MAWRDYLRNASFRHIPFMVEGAELSAGRRLARHEYPQRDEPWLEDMGRRAREYRVDAYIIGPDYMAGRDELLAAIEEPGLGQLVHPWLGTVTVTVTDATLTESTEHGGCAHFVLSFVEAGVDQEPQSAPDTSAVLDEQAAATDEAIIQDFSESFSIKKQPGFVIDDARLAVTQATAAIGGALGQIDSLMRTPAALGMAVMGLISAGVSLVSLVNYRLPVLSIPFFTPARARQTANREAITSLVSDAATARRVVDLANTDRPTLDDARADRAEISRIVDVVLYNPTTRVRTADALMQLRTEAISHIRSVTPHLPRLARVTPQATRPVIVQAHEFYGADWFVEDRAAEIVRRNRIRHPGFLLAGQPLEMVT